MPMRSARPRSPRRRDDERCSIRQGRQGVPRRRAGPTAASTPPRIRSARSPSRKVELCQQIDAAARARDPRVVSRSRSASPGSWSRGRDRPADGFVATDVRPLVRLNVSIVVEQNGRRETGFLRHRRPLRSMTGCSSPRRPVEPRDRRGAPAGAGQPRRGRRARRRNDRRAAAPAGPACCCTRRSAMGSRAISTARALPPFPAGSASGSRHRASPSSTTARSDDRRGSLSIDDEGTPTQCTVLIEDGILKGYMQDRLNARLMGVDADRQWPPRKLRPCADAAHDQHLHVGGKDDPEEIIARAKQRDLCQELRRRAGRHHQWQVRLLLHRGLSDRERQARRPDQGRDADRRRPSVLTKVTAIGNDMALDEGVGICGKGGQSVPAGVGQPTLLIEGLTVGGTAA
jgi:TldD protein